MEVMNKLNILFLIIFCNVLISDNSKKGDPEVFFVSPQTNFVSESREVRLVFGIKNFNIAPAGINNVDSGHHHLIINAELPNLNRPIPSTDNYIHSGKGQTETTIVLNPGKHTLQLLLGDFAHVPHSEPIYSEKITIEILNSK